MTEEKAIVQTEETSVTREIKEPIISTFRKIPTLTDELIGLVRAARRYVEAKTKEQGK
jgi:hypothetical protein